MSDRDAIQAFCSFCYTAGNVLPWAFLVAGGVLSVIPDLPAIWHQGAAYAMAFALLVLAGAAMLRRFSRASH